LKPANRIVGLANVIVPILKFQNVDTRHPN